MASHGDVLWDPLDLPGSHQDSTGILPEFYRNLPEITGNYRILPDRTGDLPEMYRNFYRDFTGIYRFTGIYWNLPEFTRILPGFLYRNLPGFHRDFTRILLGFYQMQVPAHDIPDGTVLVVLADIGEWTRV